MVLSDDIFHTGRCGSNFFSPGMLAPSGGNSGAPTRKPAANAEGPADVAYGEAPPTMLVDGSMEAALV
jgi:hypothetical protein